MSDAGRPARFEPEDLLAHADWARGLAAHLVRDGSDADDLVQDAMVAAIRRPPLADRPLRPWFAAVLRKLALSRRRGDGRRTRRESAAGAAAANAAGPSAADVASRLDAHRVLADAVAALPEALRATVYLRYYEGLDSTEIGRRLGIPAATVRWRLARALDELRARLDARASGGRAEWLLALAPIALPPGPAAPSGAPLATQTGITTGALAMLTTTKLLLGGAAAALVAVALLWNAGGAVLPPPGTARATSIDVAAADAARPEKRGAQARAERPRAAGAGENSAPPATPTDAAAADVPAADASATKPFAVRARVLDASGAPAAGARVECGTGGTGGTPPGANGDADGRLTFTVNAGPDVESLDFVVSATSCATRIVAAPPPGAGGVLDLGEVRLAAGGSVAGRVLDGERPLAGAAIGVQTVSGATKIIVDIAPMAQSDADGRFTLRGVSVGTQQVRVVSAGFQSAAVTVEVRAREESAAGDVRLEREDPATRIQGVVQAPDGAPVAGAIVTYRYEGHGTTGAGSITSDRLGRFEIEGGREKAWRVAARDPEGPWSPSPSADIRSGAVDVVLRLTETRWGEVSVTGPDGKPVERFAVDVWALPDLLIERMSEDVRARGVARIKLPAQSFAVVVTAAGFATTNVGPLDPAAVKGPIDVRVAALSGASGRVTSQGVAIPGARVTLRPVVRSGTLEIRNGFACLTSQSSEPAFVTATDGVFELTVRSAGRFVLRAESPGFAPAEAGPFDLGPDAGRSGIELALTEGGAIEGRVLVAPGSALDGVIVGISRGDGDARTARVGPDGAYRFERLTPGPWLVRRVDQEIRPGSAITTISAGDARFDWSCTVADAAVTRFDLDLTVEPKSAVRGELRVDGSAPAGWRLHLLDGTALFGSEEIAFAKPGDEGAFRLDAPRAGDYLVRATSPGNLTLFVPVKLADAETPLDLRIETGHVAVRGAAPAEALTLLWEDAAGRCAIAFTEVDAKGAYGPVQFPAGRVRLVRPADGVSDPRKWSFVAEGTLAAGGTLTLDVPAK